MFRTSTAAVVMMALIATAAHATVIEIPLPGLLGTYPLDAQNATRTVSFHLPDPPAVVYGVSFRVSGTTEVGTALCDGVLSEWPMAIEASMVDTPGHYWFANALMPYVAGSFAWTSEFHTFPPNATWGFLIDGSAEVSLWGAPAGLVATCTDVSVPPPTATVTEAVLIIDAEFPIPVEPSTWGRIKALYRDR